MKRPLQMCMTCHRESPLPGKQTCTACLDRARERRRRWRARVLDGQIGERKTVDCEFCGKSFMQKTHSQVNCSGECTRAAHYELTHYIPYDEWAERPRIRVLRLMRRRDWLSTEDIGNELGMINGHDLVRRGDLRRESGREALSSTVVRLYRGGTLERRLFRGVYEYRLAVKLSDRDLEPPAFRRAA